MEEYDRIEIRSEEVQEILGTPPRWIVRWGTTIAVFTVILMGVVSYIVKYPDVIQAAVVLTSAVPPESVNAKIDGTLVEFVDNREPVEKGQLIAMIESTADLNDMMYLDTLLQELDYLTQEELRTFEVDRGLILGEVQTAYSLFTTVLDQYRFEQISAYDQQNIDDLNIQKRAVKSTISQLKNKLSDLNTELNIKLEEVQKKKQLYVREVIAENEYKNFLADYQRTKQRYRDTEAEISNEELNFERINQQITRIQQNTKRTSTEQEISIRENIKQLRHAVDAWKEKYLITAPIDGTASFSKIGRENKYIKQGAEIMAIVPPAGQDSIVGKVVLPIEGSGKVEYGQDVVIKFSSYPYHEFGSVAGRVENIALLPTGKNFFVEVSLKNGLMTSYNKELTFHQEMEGSAEIITKDRRFIERVFDRLLAAFYEY